MPTLLTNGPEHATTQLILAHGAGAGMTSPWMTSLASLIATEGLRVTRFEFAYMDARHQGARKPPPKAERLMPEYVSLAKEITASSPKGQRLVIGGKSMGGRVASMIADSLFEQGIIAGLVCASYPFHPPKKLEQVRTAHLATLRCPTLIVQGERDPFGNRSEVEGYPLARAITIKWMQDGDHDLSPRASSGTTAAANLASAASAIARFCATL
ncbi:MAG: alpha/beta family hydrolase [Hyphomicrobium sp.]|jgi:hypothetical protein